MPLHGFKRHGRTQEQKDECTVRMDDLERDYWMGTDDFKEQHSVLMDRANTGRWGQGVVNSYMKQQTDVRESAEKRKARARKDRSWGELF